VSARHTRLGSAATTVDIEIVITGVGLDRSRRENAEWPGRLQVVSADAAKRHSRLASELADAAKRSDMLPTARDVTHAAETPSGGP
jgi:hypothetical protein